MYAQGYQPNRSQHLAIAHAIKEKYKVSGNVIVHYVLMDTPLRLQVQAELHYNTVNGKHITFERLEV